MDLARNNIRVLTFREDDALFHPNPGGQRQFLEDYSHRYCALAGGWFAGKTWAGARKLANLHVYNAFDADDRPTFVKSAVIAPTYQLAQDFDVPELRHAFEEMGLSYRFHADPKRFCFELPDLGSAADPSLILVRTADAPERITGWTAGAIWGDEAARWKVDDADPRGDPFLQADGRLRDPRARFLQFLLTFTHEGDATRVYQDFESDPKPDHVLYRAGSIENPHAADFVRVQRQQLSPDRQGQYLDGRAMRLRGNAMYVAFDPAANVDASLRLDPHLPLQIGVDFNIDPGMHCILGQHFTGHDLLTAVAEIHAPRMDVRQMVTALAAFAAHYARTNPLARVRPPAGPPASWPWPGRLEVFGDATGRGKWAGTGESCYDVLQEALRAAGIPAVLKVAAHNPAVADRVNAVNCALSGLDGKVRYRAHPDCRRLIEDYRRMKWSPTGQADKSDRTRSHPSDADGYRVYALMPIRRPARQSDRTAVM